MLSKFIKAFKRNSKKFMKIFRKQYVEISLLYRMIVWSMLWNFLFWHLFGHLPFYFLYFIKFGTDVVFLLKTSSLFFSGKNVDTVLFELRLVPSQVFGVYLLFRKKN